ARIAETPKPAGTLDAPIAVIPMMARDRVVGVIAIATVFDQKTAWAAVDHELFSLLGSHAATALIAANLYTTDPNAARALDGLIEHLNP
ncbi:MAG TPA: hypothetical protein ENK57_17965, partial [Polyangiaceae bacterium]|nr:hypothetical protein [Polyangiaceae bacterium]